MNNNYFFQDKVWNSLLKHFQENKILVEGAFGALRPSNLDLTPVDNPTENPTESIEGNL